ASVQTDIQLNAWNRYAVRVQAVGEISAGQFSGPVAVLTKTPVVEQVTYDGSQVSARWALVPGDDVTGYEIVFTKDGVAAPPVFSGNTSISLAAPLAATDTATLQVYAVGSRSRRPSTARVNVDADVPELHNGTYARIAITAGW